MSKLTITCKRSLLIIIITLFSSCGGRIYFPAGWMSAYEPTLLNSDKAPQVGISLGYHRYRDETDPFTLWQAQGSFSYQLRFIRLMAHIDQYDGFYTDNDKNFSIFGIRGTGRFALQLPLPHVRIGIGIYGGLGVEFGRYVSYYLYNHDTNISDYATVLNLGAYGFISLVDKSGKELGTIKGFYGLPPYISLGVRVIDNASLSLILYPDHGSGYGGAISLGYYIPVRF